MLTVEQILALAPDSGSTKSGRELANGRKWNKLARRGEIAAWGECQGSGAAPYQTRVDLSEPAFGCSCPSRKFPCKHGLGLLLLLAAEPDAFAETEPPDWVSGWLASRAERAEKQAEKAANNAAKPIDPETEASRAQSQAKRAAQREERVRDGIDDIERWLRDLVRRGLANMDLGYKFWDNAAGRLVDAQAPGLARMVREMSGIPASGAGWQDRLVERLGLLFLATQGYRRLETLPADAQADLRSLIGWTMSQDELLATNGVVDEWIVTGQHTEEEDRLQVRRTWLQGSRSARSALVLQFAHGNQPIENGGLVPGDAFEGEIVFFPGSWPLRALIKSRAEGVSVATIPGFPTADAAVAGYSHALARNPWLDRFPVVIENVVPDMSNNRWQLVDRERRAFPIANRFVNGWRLMAVSGGRPSTVCGEWNGTALLPLGVQAEGGYVPLT